MDLKKDKKEGYENEAYDVTEPNGDTTIENPEEDEVLDRDTWSNQREFLLSCIAMSVGLGNVWRFPFVAYENGGGAFLIPYVIVIFLVGKPVYLLELVRGQFSSYGQVQAWKHTPLFTGVGYGMMMATICSLSYYCYLMALTIFYFINSFAKTLPWSKCDESWAGEGNCPSPTTPPTTTTQNSAFRLRDYAYSNLHSHSHSSRPGYLYFSKHSYIMNEVDICENKSNTEINIPQEYFLKHVIKEKDSIEDGLGSPDWKLTLCTAAAWIIIFFIIIRGVKSSGKVAYFNAIFPYVVMIILLVRGATLDGAWDGIKYFIEPQWDKLYDPKVWYAACSQCFFSLTAGFGPIIMYASYNNFQHNIYKDAMIISFMDLFTSLLSGFTIFAVLGYLAKQTGTPVECVVEDGSTLAFVSYPMAIATFEQVPQLFAVLFFIMLFTLGIGSSTSDTQSIVTIVCDYFPSYPRWIVTLVICILGFFSSLIFVTPGGQYILTIVDNFGANFVVYLMAMIEVLAVAWIYGLNNFCRDIEFMLKIKVSFFWRFCWGLLIPIALVAILIYSLVTENEVEYNGPLPTSAVVSGWLLAAVCVSPIFIIGFWKIRKAEGRSLKEKFLTTLRPSKSWGPRVPKYRREWIEFCKTYENLPYYGLYFKFPSFKRSSSKSSDK